MDEEVKRRRKEKEQQAEEERQAAERMRKMEENKHLLATLFSQKPVLGPNQILKLNPNSLQRTAPGSLSQLSRMPAQSQHALQMSSLLSLQSQTQQRTHNSWPNNSTTTNQGHLPNMVSLSNNYSQFYPPSFIHSFPQQQNSSLHQTTPSPNLSSKNPLDEILDLTGSSPSPSPDSTEGRPSLDSLTGHTTAYRDDFSLESLISPNTQNAQHTAQIQQPLLLQQQQQPQHLQATQQQLNHNLLANNHTDYLDFFDLPLSPQMPTQKASPSSSTSSCSSSTSSVSNNLVSQISAGLLPSSNIIPTSTSSSLFSSPSASLFSNSSSQFSSTYLIPPSDTLSLHNGHCSSGTLDVREALNSMLQAGPDRKSVIQYRQQD